MESISSKTVDGLDVQWQVLPDSDDHFRVTIETSKGQFSQRWPLAASHKTRREAERYAAYVLAGIRGIKPSGEPDYTVL